MGPYTPHLVTNLMLRLRQVPKNTNKTSMNTNKVQKWNFNEHQQNTMNTNTTHKWTLMNNKAQKRKLMNNNKTQQGTMQQGMQIKSKQ
jgi:hypothetical protein